MKSKDNNFEKAPLKKKLRVLNENNETDDIEPKTFLSQANWEE